MNTNTAIPNDVAVASFLEFVANVAAAASSLPASESIISLYRIIHAHNGLAFYIRLSTYTILFSNNYLTEPNERVAAMKAVLMICLYCLAISTTSNVDSK